VTNYFQAFEIQGEAFSYFSLGFLDSNPISVDGKALVNLSHACSSLPSTTQSMTEAGNGTLLSSNTYEPISIIEMISLFRPNDHESDH